MSIIQRIKKLLKTPEAKHLREEVSEQMVEVADKAAEVAQEVYEKGKDVAGEVVEKGKDVVEDVKDRIQNKIDYDTFKRIEIRVGTILSVEKIEKSDKLLLLKVDVGESEPRQIVSGIATYFSDPQSLKDRQAMFVTNLEPRKIFGYESNGMIFAVNDEESFSILEPDTKIIPGTRAS